MKILQCRHNKLLSCLYLVGAATLISLISTVVATHYLLQITFIPHWYRSQQPYQQAPTFLWGIVGANSEQRQVLQNTYLKYYQQNNSLTVAGEQPSLTPNRICALSELQQGLVQAVDCQLAYIFLVENSLEIDHEETSDVMSLNVDSNLEYSATRKAIRWFQEANVWANKFSRDYIVLIDAHAMVHPIELFEFAFQFLAVPKDTTATSSVSAAVYASPLRPHRIPCTKNGQPCPLRFKDMEEDGLKGGIQIMSSNLAHFLSTHAAASSSSSSSSSLASAVQQFTYSTFPEDKMAREVAFLEFPRPHSVQDPRDFQREWNFWRDYPFEVDYKSASTAQKSRHRQYTQVQQTSQKWNNFYQRHGNTTVALVTGKFGRDSLYKERIKVLEKKIQWNGIRPENIHAYSSFPNWILSDPKWQPHLEFLTNPKKSKRGGGYWFWKAPLLLHHLSSLNDGDFVVYSDADNVDGNLDWTLDLLEEMIATGSSDTSSSPNKASSSCDLAVFQQNFRERSFTKRDAYEYFCRHDNDNDSINPSLDTSNQYYGGWFVMRKTPALVHFLQAWETSLANYDLLNDSPSVLAAEIPEFHHQHREDQSLLSLLLKCTYKEPAKRLIREFRTKPKDYTFWELYSFQLDQAVLGGSGLKKQFT
jgi:hypothetical protein